jgi:hypothetical protein
MFVIRVGVSGSGHDVVEFRTQCLDPSDRRLLLRLQELLWAQLGHIVSPPGVGARIASLELSGVLRPIRLRVDRFNAVETNRTRDNFPVHVTKGHEAEALAAQRKKKPSHLGKAVLKLLGFKGEVGSDYVGEANSPHR